jgi:hypothetical protein
MAIASGGEAAQASLVRAGTSATFGAAKNGNSIASCSKLTV